MLAENPDFKGRQGKDDLKKKIQKNDLENQPLWVLTENMVY